MEDTAQSSDTVPFDNQQIDLALAGDQKAYRTLFNRYRILKKVHNEENAKDLFIGVFLKASQTCSAFRKDTASAPGSTGSTSTISLKTSGKKAAYTFFEYVRMDQIQEFYSGADCPLAKAGPPILLL